MKIKGLILLMSLQACSSFAAQPLNVVFVTFDDLSRGSLGVYDCPVPDITPNLDRLANSGLRFEHCHVQSGNCTPSRNLIMMGQYQQRNHVFSLGKEGAGNQLNENTIPTVFRAAGYHTGIMGKNPHQCPFEPYSGWDVEYDSYGSTRDPQNVYEKTVQAIAASKKLGKPLFFNLNLYDPHTGWYAWKPQVGTIKLTKNEKQPSRIYGPDEVPYPSWFPPLSESAKVGTTKGGTKNVNIMQEVAAYYNSVKRSDDSFGKMLQAFDEAGLMEKTIFVVMSDHGVQLAGGKTTLYHEGSISPLFIKWPGVTKRNTVNDTHMIASIDLLPTFSEMAGQPIPHDLDGRSFLPLIKGEAVSVWRAFIYKQQNDRNKSRAILTKEWLYIINPWADGTQKFGSVTSGMFSWKLLTEARDNPESSQQTKDWVNKIEYRMFEELYNVAEDPGCRYNLAGDKAWASRKEAMRKLMESEVLASGDSIVLDAVRNPNDSKVMKQTTEAIEAMVMKQRDNPDYAREVNFDPHDDWVVIDHTHFEPFGEWGIWTADGDEVALNRNNGHEVTGNSCVEFKGLGVSRIVTAHPINASAFRQLKLDLRIPKKARNKKGKNDKGSQAPVVGKQTKLTFQYKDQKGWHDLQSLEGRKIPGDHNLIFDAPKNGWPKSMLFGIQVDFGGKSGRIALDAIRFTGWEDWKLVSEDQFESGLGNWTGKDGVAINKGSAQLSGKKAMLEMKDSAAADQVGLMELTYQFRSENFGPGDRLCVESYTGSSWEPLKTHDYAYVLVPGCNYAGKVDLNTQDHKLSKDFRIRFRCETGKAANSVSLDHVRLRSRFFHGE